MAPASLFLALVLLSTCAAALPAPHAPILRPRQSNTTNATFDSVVPSAELKWVPCYEENFQCSFLTVPLDYQNVSVGTTDIAFVRYLVSEQLDDILFNPGGPGGSGVDYILSAGPVFAERWEFNPVGFDPRGVGWTGPTISCSYGNDTAIRKRQIHPLGDLSGIWDEFLELYNSCSVANEHTDAKYVGTSAAVQDLVHFTELQAAARGKDPKTALINFYGVSYGTVIGQTLVAMHPDRVNRVLLDANVYGVAHYQGWEPSSIDDVAHYIFLFSKLCFEAGEKWCILAESADSTQEVHRRFDLALETLRNHPPTIDGESYDDNSFLAQLGPLMYNPRTGFPTIANMTASILRGNMSFAEMTDPDLAEPGISENVVQIITAVDIAGRYPWKTYEQWKAAADRLAETAPYGAKGFAIGSGFVGTLSIIPPPSQYFPGFKAIRPRTSVLFVNTVADHVTPTASARQMSKLFLGSGVVIVNGPGHSYGSSPSHCTTAIVAKYMKDGTVPEKETWCEPDVAPEYYFGAPAENWTTE